MLNDKTIVSKFKTIAKKFLYKRAPRAAFAISAIRQRQKEGVQSSNIRQIARKELFKDREPHVLGGPFAGMRYVDEYTYGPIAPKWLGVYEPQLHLWIRRLATASYDSFVNIGAAEGYYAVGLGRIRPDIRIITFEADFLSRRSQYRMAQINGVHNIYPHSLCNHRALKKALGLRPFILCDIEGGELELIDPSRCEDLLRAELIIETHPVDGLSVPEVTRLVADRFRRTHTVEIVRDDPAARERFLEDLASSGVSLLKLQEFSFEDRRQPNEWLIAMRKYDRS